MQGAEIRMSTPDERETFYIFVLGILDYAVVEMGTHRNL